MCVVWVPFDGGTLEEAARERAGSAMTARTQVSQVHEGAARLFMNAYIRVSRRVEKKMKLGFYGP